MGKPKGCTKARRANAKGIKRLRNGQKNGPSKPSALSKLTPTDMGRPMFRQVADAREALRIWRYNVREPLPESLIGVEIDLAARIVK